MSYKKQIEMCLNCKKIECDNCLDPTYQAKQISIENGTSRNVSIECNGEFYTMKEWARLLDIKYATLTRRLRSNINIMDMAEYNSYIRTKRKLVSAY